MPSKVRSNGENYNLKVSKLVNCASALTLIEFVVALAIFALVASGLITAQLRTQELSAQTRHLTQMTNVLQSATSMFLVAHTNHDLIQETVGFVSDEALPFTDVDPDTEGVQVAILVSEDGTPLVTGTVERRVWVMSGSRPDTLLGAEFRITVDYRDRTIQRTMATNRSVNL